MKFKAETLRAIADGKQIQFKERHREVWKDVNPEGYFRHMLNGAEYDYRTKPEFIEIRVGSAVRDVPAPYRGPMVLGQKYWSPQIDNPGLELSVTHQWSRVSPEGDIYDAHLMEGGLIHLDKEAAHTHALALRGQ